MQNRPQRLAALPMHDALGTVASFTSVTSERFFVSRRMQLRGLVLGHSTLTFLLTLIAPWLLIWDSVPPFVPITAFSTPAQTLSAL